MINKKIGVLLLFALLVSFGAKAQRATSMRINEVLVINEDNFVDDYGKRHAWIELFNNSAGSVNIAGCYLTNDKSNPKKYPKGDVLTVIPPRQHTLFWADGEPDRGTFHVNFTLDPSKENYIALYDADGKTLIDEIVIPASQKADVSYGRTLDGQGEWTALTKVTPSTNNVTLDSNEKIENFKENDSWGIGMTLTAMAVVFSGLFLLFIIFKQIGKLSIAASKRNAQKAAGAAVIADNAGQESGEIFAAIGAALYEMSDDKVHISSVVDDIAEVEVNGTPYQVKMEKPAKKQMVTLKRPAQAPTTASGEPVISRPAASTTKGAVKSPLPGVILQVNCKVGDTVKRGQNLLVLEAMKMENNINADRDGKIIEIKVNKGDSVLEGADLVVIG